MEEDVKEDKKKMNDDDDSDYVSKDEDWEEFMKTRIRTRIPKDHGLKGELKREFLYICLSIIGVIFFIVVMYFLLALRY